MSETSARTYRIAIGVSAAILLCIFLSSVFQGCKSNGGYDHDDRELHHDEREVNRDARTVREADNTF